MFNKELERQIELFNKIHTHYSYPKDFRGIETRIALLESMKELKGFGFDINYIICGSLGLGMNTSNSDIDLSCFYSLESIQNNPVEYIKESIFDHIHERRRISIKKQGVGPKRMLSEPEYESIAKFMAISSIWMPLDHEEYVQEFVTNQYPQNEKLKDVLLQTSLKDHHPMIGFLLQRSFSKYHPRQIQDGWIPNRYQRELERELLGTITDIHI